MLSERICDQDDLINSYICFVVVDGLDLRFLRERSLEALTVIVSKGPVEDLRHRSFLSAEYQHHPHALYFAVPKGLLPLSG